MSQEDRTAQALARWLDDHPGNEPPNGIDTDVIEAVYSLRPDLAPSARVSADDILELVTSGPLAVEGSIAAAPVPDGPEGEVVPFPAPAVQQPAQATAPHQPQGSQRRMVWWLGGGTATMLAAAAVLVLILPSLQSGPPVQATESYSITPSAPMAAAPVADPAPALAVADNSVDAPAPPASTAREQGFDMQLPGIVTESGDGVADDAVADVGEIPITDERDLMEDVASMDEEDLDVAPAVTIISGGGTRSAPARSASTSVTKVSVNGEPNPWPKSDSPAGAHLDQARKLLDAGRYDKAQQAADKGLALEKADTPVRQALRWVKNRAVQALSTQGADDTITSEQ